MDLLCPAFICKVLLGDIQSQNEFDKVLYDFRCTNLVFEKYMARIFYHSGERIELRRARIARLVNRPCCNERFPGSKPVEGISDFCFFSLCFFMLLFISSNYFPQILLKENNLLFIFHTEIFLLS